MLAKVSLPTPAISPFVAWISSDGSATAMMVANSGLPTLGTTCQTRPAPSGWLVVMSSELVGKVMTWIVSGCVMTRAAEMGAASND